MLQKEEGLPRSEQVMLIGMLVISAYMYANSHNYPVVARTFPQITAAITIAGSGILLFRNYLPAPLRGLATTSSDIGDVNVEELVENDDEPKEEQEERELNRPLSNEIFVTLLTSAYVLIGLTIGFIWITPLFTAIYLLWFDIRRYLVAILAALSYVLCLLFVHVLNFDIDVGYLL